MTMTPCLYLLMAFFNQILYIFMLTAGGSWTDRLVDVQEWSACARTHAHAHTHTHIQRERETESQQCCHTIPCLVIHGHIRAERSPVFKDHLIRSKPCFHKTVSTVPAGRRRNCYSFGLWYFNNSIDYSRQQMTSSVQRVARCCP